MIKLSDTQAIILSAAAQRENRIAPPLPESLRGGAATMVVGALRAKGFLEEVDADMRNGEPIWRETGDGHGVTLVAADVGLVASASSPKTRTPPAGTTVAPSEEPAPDAGTGPKTAPKAHTPREGTMQATLIAHAACAGGRDHRGDHGYDGLSVAQGARHDCRGAEEEARARGDLGAIREPGACVQTPRRLTHRTPTS